MLLLVFLALLFQSEYRVYLPVISNPANNCGVEVWRNEIYAEQLQPLGCLHTRYNYGTAFDPGLYRTYVLYGKTEFEIIESDLSKMGGMEPIVVFMGNGSGTCAPLGESEWVQFSDFVIWAISEWDLKHIELWNEADAEGGLANLYGCWGTGKQQAFVDMMEFITGKLWEVYPQLIIGTSFMYNTSISASMIENIASAFSNESRFFIGIHHYKYYQGVESLTLLEKISTIKTFWSGKLWLTETNLLLWSKNQGCGDPPIDFKQAQAEYIENILATNGVDVKIFYGLWPYQSRWYCASLLENNLLPSLGLEVIINYDK